MEKLKIKVRLGSVKYRIIEAVIPNEHEEICFYLNKKFKYKWINYEIINE